MAKKEINLEEILKSVYLHELVSEERFYIVKNAVKETIRQALELAAENAIIKGKKRSQYGKYRKWQNVRDDEEVDLFSYEVQWYVNKQSIINTIDQIE